MLWSNFHWKCTLGKEIVHLSDIILEKNKICDSKIKWTLQRTILSLENGNSSCRKRDCKLVCSRPVETHKFMIHLGSCLWGELLYYKRWGSVAVILSGVLLSIAIPCFMSLPLQGWSAVFVIFAMLIFFISPLFSGMLIVVVMSCITTSQTHLLVISLLTCWCVLNVALVVYSFVREGYDELSLMRWSYQSDLPLYLKDVKDRDSDIMIYIRGYGE